MEEAQKEENIIQRLEECKKKCEEYLNGWKRERADFLNYKKDEEGRISALIEYTRSSLILKLLPMIDNITVAAKQIPEHLKGDTWIQGFFHIKKQAEELLKKEGIEEIKTIGEMFDPSIHEVIEEISKEGQGHGVILEEVQKGYLLSGRVIQPAKVKIAK